MTIMGMVHTGTDIIMAIIMVIMDITTISIPIIVPYTMDRAVQLKQTVLLLLVMLPPASMAAGLAQPHQATIELPQAQPVLTDGDPHPLVIL
jgi:hypothetical protein